MQGLRKSPEAECRKGKLLKLVAKIECLPWTTQEPETVRGFLVDIDVGSGIRNGISEVHKAPLH